MTDKPWRPSCPRTSSTPVAGLRSPCAFRNAIYASCSVRSAVSILTCSGSSRRNAQTSTAVLGANRDRTKERASGLAMLALSDAALAQVVIAAGAIEPGGSGPRGCKVWLSSSLGKASVHAGVATPVLGLVAPARRRNPRSLRLMRPSAAVGLVQHNFLDPSLADDPAALSEAARRALLALCERSPPEQKIYDTVRNDSSTPFGKDDARLPRTSATRVGASTR